MKKNYLANINVFVLSSALALLLITLVLSKFLMKKLANLEMARAIRLVTVERGLDPVEFTLFGFGGAG